MKRINFNFSLVTGFMASMAIVSLVFFVLFSCENVNSIHKEYLDRGEAYYIGAADSIKVYAGNLKIKFEWKISADPRITKTVIYWDKRAESVVIPVVRTTEGEMWLETQLNNIREAEYVFEFEMQDDNGNISRPVEIAGIVLGDVYIENLRNRGIKELAKLETGDMQIIWEAVNVATLQYSVIEYLNKSGQAVRVTVPNNDDKTLLQGLDTGDEIELYAIHLPENGLESFETVKRKFSMPKFEREINKANFVARFKPGDNTTPHPGGGVDDWQKPITDFGVGQRSFAKIWDGGSANNTNGSTILHTEDQSNSWATARFKFPHKFTLDMGTLATLSRIRIWARTDNGAFTGHSPRYFELWATDEPKEMSDFGSQAEFEEYYRTTYVVHKSRDNQVQTNPNGNAAYTGQEYIEPAPAPGIHNWQEDWVKLGDFEISKPSMSNFNTSNDADKAVWAAGSDFNLIEVGKKVRYLRLVLKYPNWQHTNCINLGEITLYGDDI